VDHGKTTLLDKIRSTIVASGEAGAITQAIGVSIIPMETIYKICGKLMDSLKGKITIPGLLAIDTPGHAAFASLRKRGGSLADIAILVVDINEGFKPQTIESLEILKANRVPFVVAVNKIDLLNRWKYDPTQYLLPNLAALDYQTQGEFEAKMYDLVAKLNALGLQAERFDRVEDYTKQIALVPLSARTGQGIPELLMVLTGLAQKYLEQNLVINEFGNCKGTTLEVKEDKGLGTTINAIIYNGCLHVGDTIIVGGLEHPIVTKIRALLEPGQLVEMRDKKSKFQNVKEVTAATGVKIVAPGLETAVAGMPLRSCTGNLDEIKQLSVEVQQEVGETLNVELAEEGVVIKADTIGGLEALRHLLHEKNIPISSASLGEITKKDLAAAEMMKEKNLFYGVILGFNIPVAQEVNEAAAAKNIRLLIHDVIYRSLEEYEQYTSSLKKEIELRELNNLVRPAKILFLKGYVFRQNNPAIIGIEVEIGRIKNSDPIMNEQGKHLTTIKSMKEGQENVSLAEQGKQVAMALDGITVGRQINEGDFFYTDLPEDDFKKLKELKKYLSTREVEVLKEIAEIKRRDNPVWGV
ncbi:TPA: translation initiation factor IF-2, partial [Candidatus Woesearchaeota archaeon]|nr:translation initiation factor IF-2 [Candidatus Woesearchaeota archaeon]